MANTMTLIASSTVSANGTTASIDFTSIPSTYTDLLLVASTRSDRAGSYAGNMGLKFNTSTANITGKILRGIGTSPDSYSGTIAEWGAPAATTTANTFGNASFYFPNYAGSSNKSVSIDSVIEDNSANMFTYMTAGLWSVTSAITGLSIYVRDASSYFTQYSTAYLYGIKNS